MKRLRWLVLLALLVLLAPSAVLAAGAYRSEITVTDSSSAARTGVPALVSMGISEMVSKGFLGSDGLDTRVFEGTQEQKYMVADDKLGIFIPTLSADQQRTYKFETGYSPPNVSFGLIPGTGGYVTVADDAVLELGNDFEIEISGYVDTSSGSGKNLVYKEDAYKIYVSDDEKVKSVVQEAYKGDFPTVAAINGGNDVVDQTSHTVNLPSGIVSGNLLIVIFATDVNPSVTFPAGWTVLFDTANGAEVRVVAYYRIADGTEGGTITVTTGGAQMTAHTSYRITGYGDVPEVGTSVTGTSVSPNPPSLSPTWGASNTLWLAVCGYGGNPTVSAYPADYTDGRNDYSNDANGCGVGSARRNLNAASEDPGTFTLSASSYWVANTIAIGAGYGDGTTSAEVSGVSSGEHTVRAYADPIANEWGLIVDEGEAGEISDIVALGATTVPPNDNSWYLMQNNVMPYMEYYKHSVDGTLVVHYEPVTIIKGEDYSTGTVAVTNTSTTVVGSSTAWTSGMVGSLFVSTDGVQYVVDSVTDATHLELTTAYGGSTLSGQSYNLYVRLPDREGTAQDGRITWGDNSNLDITVGGLKSITSYSSTSSEEAEPEVIVGAPEEITGFIEGTGEPTTMPWYDLFRPAAIGTPVYSAGTVTGIGETNTLSGTGTNWIEDYRRHSITVGGYTYTIDSIDSSTELTLTTNLETSPSGATYAIRSPSLQWDTRTLYGVMAVFVGIGIGVGVAIATGSFLLAAIAVGVGLAVGAGQEVLGWWVVLAYGLFAGAYLGVTRSF